MTPAPETIAAVIEHLEKEGYVLCKREPVAHLHQWIEYHPFGDTYAGEPMATVTEGGDPFDKSDTVTPLYAAAPPYTPQALAVPEEESGPVYVMGHYTGDGRVTSVSVGLPTDAFKKRGEKGEG